MEKFLINFLLWPWLHVWQKGLWPAIFSARMNFLIALLFICVVIFIRHKLVEKRIKRGSWPIVLSCLVRSFFSFVALIFLGMAANELPQWLNNSNMPIAPHNIREIETYRNDVSNFKKPVVADLPKTGVVGDSVNEYLTDYIRVEESDRLGVIVFSGTGYISPGDILIATGAIVSWWITLAICFWAALYVACEITRRLSRRKTQT